VQIGTGHQSKADPERSDLRQRERHCQR
jgi:hypothetical protein